MSLVVVGSVAYDGIQTGSGKVDRTLGGSCTYIALAASYFTRTRIVAVVGDDFEEADLTFLVSRGIDVTGLERVPGKTFYWAGVYSEDMNSRTTLTTELNVFASFQPKLPGEYLEQPYLLLGNIQPALQKSVLAQMRGLRIAAGDTMNYWIQGYREELLETIKDWDVLLLNDSEARLLSGQYNLRRAAEAILEMGPRTLLIKRGEYGALLVRRDVLFAVPGYLLETVHDPTGAGDAFAGGFIGYLAGRGLDLRSDAFDPRELRRAAVYGSVMGSFCCENFGVDRFRTLTRAEIDARYQEFQALTAF